MPRSTSPARREIKGGGARMGSVPTSDPVSRPSRLSSIGRRRARRTTVDPLGARVENAWAGMAGGGARMADRRRWARLGAAFVSLVLIAWAGAAAAGERVIEGAGPAAWQDDLAPIAARTGATSAPRTCSSAPASAARRRRSSARGHDARAGGAPSGPLPGDRQQPARTVRALRRPRPGARALPAEPPGHHRARERDRRGAGREGQAGRQPPHAAGGRTSSSTGCARAAWRPIASPTGGPTACSPRSGRCEEKMALFWHGHFATNEEKVRDYRKMLRAARAVPRATAPATSATS